jgi:hypothetical protein
MVSVSLSGSMVVYSGSEDGSVVEKGWSGVGELVNKSVVSFPNAREGDEQ